MRACEGRPSLTSIQFSRIEFEGETCLLDENPRLVDELVRRLRKDADRREQEERLCAQRGWWDLVDEVKSNMSDIRARRGEKSEQKMRELVAERRESIARLSLVDPFLPCPVQDRLSTSQSERGYELKSGTTRGSLGSSVRSVLTRHSTESKKLSMNLKCHPKQACRSSWWHLSRSLPVNSADFWPAS